MLKYDEMTKEDLIKTINEIEEKYSSDHFKKNLNELNAHQIELESQNRELIESRRELEISQNRYVELYDFAPAGYLILDNNGIIREINLTGAKMLDMERTNLLGLSLTQFLISKDVNKFFSILEKCRETNCPEIGEIKFYGEDNNEKFMEIATVPFKENDCTISYRTIITDITRQKLTEKDNKNLKKHLYESEKMRAIGTLAGGIAHEFNNMLGVMLGYTELSILDLPEGSITRENLEHVIKTGIKAKELITQLLIFSQKKKAEEKPIILAKFVKESINLLSVLLPPNIDLHQDIESSGTILGNSDSIYQILLHLVDNAIYAIGKEKGAIEVTLKDVKYNSLDSKKSEIKSYVNLTVSDTGTGMEKEIRKKIFDPFFTTNKIGEGSGMGLSVVYGLVKNHNGEIKVYSEKGKGTTFHILFPCLSGIEYDDTPPEPDEYLLKSVGKKNQILFVDDKKDVVNVGRLILNRIGYDVVTKMSGKEALQTFLEQPYAFDLVITDLTMPVMTGIELAEELVLIRPDIPIILCTGYNDYIDINEPSSQAIKAIVNKPFTISNMAKVINRLLS